VKNGSTQKRLAAILAADVVGYTRLMEVDSDGTVAAWQAARSDIIDPSIAEHAGRIVKHTGDGFLVEFATVQSAVECAVAIQDGLSSSSLDFRMGINLGDVIDDGEDLHGEGVNIAARIESLANPGEVNISASVFEQVRNRLDCPFEDLGEHEVKNVSNPVHIYRISNGTSSIILAPGTEEVGTEKPSIAVLAFDNMSGDPEQEYFSDGITEDIITALSKFHSFFVISRNSTFTFKGRSVNVSNVADELGARYVIEGSVRKAGNRMRVTAQLIEAASGNHIWAERYDRDIEDIFELQDEITQTIAGAIEPEIGSVERNRATQKRPDSLEAWELLQRGMHHVYQMDREGLQNGIELLRQCVTKDPGLAQAHSILAFALMHQILLGTIDDFERAMDEARTHTNAAIKYDDGDSLAHEMLGRLLSFQHQYDEAIAEAERAIQFNPNSSSAYFALGVVSFFADRPAKAIEAVESAMRLSPKDPRHFALLHTKGCILGELGRIEEALVFLRQAVNMPHGDYRSAMLLARYASEAGLIEEATIAAKRVLELKPDFTLNLFETKLSTVFHPNLMSRFLHFLSNVGLPE